MVTPGDFQQIDKLKYNYGSLPDVRLEHIHDDLPQDSPQQLKRHKAFDASYGYDGNGNCVADGGHGAGVDYNLLNLPRQVTGGGGLMFLDYTFGGEKIRKEVTGIGGETRLYLGGAEFVNGVPECYNHPEGRVLLVAGAKRFQYKIADHLGDMCVFFEDVDEDGIVKTEAAGPAESEVFQRHFYYPFGMGMEGGWAVQTLAENKYQNGKELEKGRDWAGWMMGEAMGGRAPFRVIISPFRLIAAPFRVIVVPF